MSDLNDFEFDKTEDEDEYSTGQFERDEQFESEEPGGAKRWLPVALIGLVVLAGLLYWMTRSEPEPEPEPAPPVVEESTPEPELEPEPEEALILPELDASDELVRQLVEALSSNPRFAGMLVTDNLVRRFTASVANIAEGQSPRSHLESLEPPEPFSVRRVDSRLVPSAKSYARYDLASEIIASLDTQGTVKLYRQLEPLIDESYEELGYPGQDFDDVLLAALDHLIATPTINADTELVERVTVYHYADPQLENLSAAQKQLLRAGPENARKIQAALRALRSELSRDG